MSYGKGLGAHRQEGIVNELAHRIRRTLPECKVTVTAHATEGWNVAVQYMSASGKWIVSKDVLVQVTGADLKGMDEEGFIGRIVREMGLGEGG